MEEVEEISGPWRATRLWNTIIRNFRTGMPLKKHKKNMKTYENCFSSSDAVDWLHKHLQKNPNFGADVTKEQTLQLLKKLYRAGIIENVREEANELEFKASGEFYKFSNKSPVKNLRTPGKSDRKPLTETGNTPRMSRSRERTNGDSEHKPEREKSVNRKMKEEAKKQLNLSYFQALPSNSLIILDNDDTWRKVYMDQLASMLSRKHTEQLDYAGQLDMDTITHNMTKVSAKGIVQVESKEEDLPHWVLSAMKCLANWPKQLRTVNGKESCLPNYTGFEHDVFNVVKDYFLALSAPLSTYPLYDFFIEAYLRAEGVANVPKPPPKPVPASRPCPRPFMQSNPNDKHQSKNFYTMVDKTEDISMLSHQERVARIRQTFEYLPPLATSSMHNSNNTNSTFSGHSTFDTISPNTLSPDMSTTAIMKQFLPPNTCFETAFVEESPITRIVPQKDHETLHIKRSWSGRSLSHIPTDWATKSTSTQTDTQEKSSSLKRLPKWKRTSRFRKSIAVMESQDRRKSVAADGTADTCSEGGIVNGAFAETPDRKSLRTPDGQPRKLYSTSDLPQPPYHISVLRGSSSVDNLLDRENKFEEQFMMKYRQVSGDLRRSCDLAEVPKESSEDRDKSFIESKAVRKEKKKKRYRAVSCDRHGYDTDNEVRYDSESRYGYVNHGLVTSPVPTVSVEGMAPLAMHEVIDLSPVPFNRHGKHNASYRMATNQPTTPAVRYSFPRTSTQIDLQGQPLNNNPLCRQQGHSKPDRSECLYVRAEPYMCLNSDVSSVAPSDRGMKENLYTAIGPGPITRYAPPTVMRQYPPASSFRRDTGARASRCSQATVDSGRYSDYSRTSVPTNRVPPPACSSLSAEDGHYSKYQRTIPHHLLLEKLKVLSERTTLGPEQRAVGIFKLLTLLIPPPNRRKVQLLLKFIRKVSLNTELCLDPAQPNRELSLNTFTPVIIRPGDSHGQIKDIERKIVNLFINFYDEIWSPPDSLRREVEEKVYQSLVNRRIQAGEDPYPVTYCRQVTKSEYESSRLTGAEAGLLDLLQAIVDDTKMSDKEKSKKLRKFKESYPQLWKRKFPDERWEPDLGVIKKDKSGSKLASFSRIRSVVGI